jgi:hypothetical protein
MRGAFLPVSARGKPDFGQLPEPTLSLLVDPVPSNSARKRMVHPESIPRQYWCVCRRPVPERFRSKAISSLHSGVLGHAIQVTSLVEDNTIDRTTVVFAPAGNSYRTSLCYMPMRCWVTSESLLLPEPDCSERKVSAIHRQGLQGNEVHHKLAGRRIGSSVQCIHVRIV